MFMLSRVLILLLIATVAIGCGSRRAKNEQTLSDIGNNEPWFCEMDAAAVGWDCVRSAALAANPQPTRLPAPKQPPVPTQPPAAAPAAESVALLELVPDPTQEQLVDPADGPADGPAHGAAHGAAESAAAEPGPEPDGDLAEPGPDTTEQPVSAPVAEPVSDTSEEPVATVAAVMPGSEPEAEAIAPDTSEAEETELTHEAAAPDQEAALKDNRPDYQRLAYVPDGAVMLSDLPPEFYAVQLIAFVTERAVVAFANEHRLAGFSTALVDRDGEQLFILLLGVYEDLESARLAAASRPASLANYEPWVRSMANLQQVLVPGEDKWSLQNPS